MATFKASLVERVLRRAWGAEADAEADREAESELESDEEPAAGARARKIHADAVKLSAEFLRLFVLEALHRAQMEAMVDDSAEVQPRHLEQVLAQLLLDF